MKKSFACLATCTIASSAFAQPSFTGLGFLPGTSPSTVGGISADGTVIAGVSGNNFFRRVGGGALQDLGTFSGGFGATVTAVSADGSTIVGYAQLPAGVGYRGFRWTAAEGFVTLDPVVPNLPGAVSFANDVNADGTVIVGGSRATSGGATRATRWTTAGDKQDLFNGQLLGVSNDGAIAGGTVATTNHAALWTLAGGVVDITPAVPGSSVVDAINGDGSLMAGRIGPGMYLFTPTTQRLLATTALPNSGYYPLAIGDDGWTVVGSYSQGAPLQLEYATAWCPSLGLVNLNTYLPSIGISLTGWTLDRAYDTSADGQYIIGNGTHNGQAEAWVAHIPTGCLADVGTQGGFAGHDGQLNNNDFVAFISMFFNQDPRADRGVQGGLPGSDNTWDNNDFVVFIDQFFAGC
jgi:uncharacterized membrane protein